MNREKTYSLGEIAEITKGELRGDGSLPICGIACLEAAGPKEISFFYLPPYQMTSHHKAYLNSRAGAILLAPSMQRENCICKHFILVENPSLAFEKVCQLFLSSPQRKSAFVGRHPTALVHSLASIGKGVTLGPHVVVDQYAKIGDHSSIGAGSYIGPLVEIGEESVLHPHVVIEESSLIGKGVIIHSGAVIGSPGFGYITSPEGKHEEITQWGRVIIQDYVTIGANSLIDKPRFGETQVGEGSKLDGAVKIGHGVKMGTDNLCAAQVGIAGSTRTGKRNVFGGQVGIGPNLDLVDDVIVTAQSGVSKSLSSPGIYSSSFPAVPINQHRREYRSYRNSARSEVEKKVLKGD